ncbi:MAG: hypothetical protein AB1679_36460 [Actinomycetota bacterium]
MRTRCTRVVAVVAALAALTAGPALAHEEITPNTIPVGRAAFLTLTAANESSADLVRIVLRAPAGVSLGAATRSPAGWSASRSGDSVTWTGGALKPQAFESWGFEVEGPDQPGTLAFTVTLGYAGGRTDEHEVEITAAAPGAGASAPVTTATSATTTSTSPAAAGEDSGEAQADSGGGSGEASGTAKAALAISIVALLVAAGALAAASRRRGGPGPAGGSESTAAAAQDW